MDSCIKCGKEIQQNSKFCSFCGSLQNDKVSKKLESISNTEENRKKTKLIFILLLVILGAIAGGYAIYINKIEIEKQAQAQAAEDERMRQESVDRERERLEAEARVSQERERAEAAARETYEAVLTCGMNTNDHINILACFAKSSYGADTELELRNENDYGLYKAYNISSLGREYNDGFHIQLKHNFSIKAQNSHNLLTLSLKIIDSKGDVVFQKSVGQYGVISVEN